MDDLNNIMQRLNAIRSGQMVVGGGDDGINGSGGGYTEQPTAFQAPKSELFPNGSVAPTDSPFTPGWNYGFLQNIPNLKRFENIEGGPPQPGALESFSDGNFVYNVSRQQFEDGTSNGAFPVAITKRALSNFNTKNGIYNGVKEGSFGQVLNPDGTVQSEGLYHPTRDSEELKKWGTGIAAAVGLILGGTALVGQGAGSAGAAAGGASAGGTGAAASSTFGGLGSGGFGIGAGEGFGSGIVAGEGLGSFGGLGAGAGFGETFGGSMAGLGSAGASGSSLFGNNSFTRQLGKQGLKQILGSSGGGSNSPSNNGSGISNGGGGMDYGSLASLFATGLSDYRNGQAGEKMRGFLDQQLGKIDNLYAPGSPEYNLMKQEMERKDAAAGRNSQYGVRATELAGKIAQIKAENLSRMVPGISRAYATALNQDANRYSGLAAQMGAGNRSPLGSLLNNGGGLSQLFGGSGTNGLGSYSTDGTPVNGNFFDGDFFGDSGGFDPSTIDSGLSTDGSDISWLDEFLNFGG